MLILIRKTGWVGKYCVGTAKLGSACIHHLNKTVNRSADVLSKLKGNIICRSKHDRIQTLFYGKNLINLCRDIGSSVGNPGYTGCSHSDLVGKLRVFQCKECGHDFDSSSGIKNLIHVFGIECCVGAVFHDDGSSGCDIRTLRPSGYIVR